MKKEIKEGKSPAIHYSERTWNDKSKGIIINMKAPPKVYFHFHFQC